MSEPADRERSAYARRAEIDLDPARGVLVGVVFGSAAWALVVIWLAFL